MAVHGRVFDRVAVVGLVKLGLPWACVMASKGIRVVGIDVNPAIVESIGKARFDNLAPLR